MTNEWLNRIKAKIHDADLQTSPFPHIEVQELFPTEFYRQLIESLPKHHHYGVARHECLYTYVCRKLTPIWQDVITVLESETIRNVLCDRFSRGPCRGSSRFRLHKDVEGFEVSPHRDIEAKLVSVLVYLPREQRESLEIPLGTHLCVPNTNRAYGEGHYSWDDFDIVKTVTYVPNKLFAFAPDKETFHAVRPVWPEDWTFECDRDILKGFVFKE